MTRLPLSLACGDYDITRALSDGSVRPDGIDLTVLTGDKERIFRLDRRAECDVAELNIVQYLKAREAGAALSALAVFPHRRFRLGSIYVRRGLGIDDARDLEGRPVGIGGFEPAAAVWIRGILAEYHGLRLDAVDWQDVFGSFGRLPDDQDEPAHADDAAARHGIDRLLADGVLHATVSAYAPPQLLAGDPSLTRLFPDAGQVDRAYFATSGVFPIMHVVTVQTPILERHPWVAASLFDAFVQARRSALRRLRNPRTLPLAFAQEAWNAQVELLGPDPWRYGLTDGNRRAVAAIVRYAHEQGITHALPAVDALFTATDPEPSGPISIV